MKIALIGANGRAGSRILREALDRSHRITAIVRRPETLPPSPNLTIVKGDAANADRLAVLLIGQDAAISAVRFTSVGAAPIIAAAQQAGVRLLVVGGAGTLEMAPGIEWVDMPEFPVVAKNESLAGRAFLNALRQERELSWTFLSPSGSFEPGVRTGQFRLGGDQMLKDANGRAWISMEDFAIAMIDEVERPRHIRRRFVVGY